MDLRTLRVHSWGGFGSQLNALAFALEIVRNQPRRKIELVIHTGGITRRDLEIEPFVPEKFKIRRLDDFSLIMSNHAGSKVLGKFTSRLATFLGVIVFSDRRSELSRIRSWTMSTRGHYSYITHSDIVLKQLCELLSIPLEEGKDSNENIIHYRLGDLLSNMKGHIDSTSISSLLNTASQQSWTILTESPADAKSLLTPLIDKSVSLTFAKVEPATVLRKGVLAQTFIGTNSKLSIWIVIIRSYMKKRNTFMPISLKLGLSTNLTQLDLDRIHFYEDRVGNE